MHQPSPTILRPPVAGVFRALAHAVALIASARRILNPSNIPTRARLRHQLIAREDAEAESTASLLGRRIPVKVLAERSAVYLPIVLVRRGPADEDRRCAVLVVLARLAAGRGVFVRALVFDAAGAGAVVRDAVEGSSAPALSCDAVGGVGAFVHALPFYGCASCHSGAVDRGGCSRHGDIVGWSDGHVCSSDIGIGQARDH